MFVKKTYFLMIFLVAASAVFVQAEENQAEVTARRVETSQSVQAIEETTASLPAVYTSSAENSAEPVVKSGGETHGKSWWKAFTDGLGLTDSDPGVTVKPAPSIMAKPSSEYIIGPGDVLGISVWRDENLTRTVVVLPDGKIALPLAGEIAAEGKTVSQLKTELEKALSRYTADSVVTVEVKQSNSLIIYVTGRVKSPGRQMMVANTNVLQALIMAGGLDPFASSGKIRIFRQQEGKTVMYAFDYDEVMEGRHLETNIELKRGDVIIVP